MPDLWRTLAFVVLTILIADVTLASRAETAKFKVLASFGHPKLGSDPVAPVLIDPAGNLFTTASQGAAHDDGTVVELKPKSGTKGYTAQPIFRFNGQGGSGMQPNGSLIIDTKGNLYGVAKNLVYELSPVAGQTIWSEQVLYRFCSLENCSDGNFPVGGLTYMGASGGAPYDGISPLYGLAQAGGANKGGAVFQLTNNGGIWSETVLYNFCSTGGSTCTDGNSPRNLLMDGDGNLFGSAVRGGGEPQAGTVFVLKPSGDTWSFAVLYRFCGQPNCADGAGPTGTMTFDAAGNLLGTTGGGGGKCKADKVSGCGTIFELTSNGTSWQERVLYAFCRKRDCKDGWGPIGLTIDSLGNLYGTTADGGGNDIDQLGVGGGIVFKFDGGLHVLHRFCSLANCADGERPLAGVSLDKQENLFGSTSLGGDFGNGEVFKLK